MIGAEAIREMLLGDLDLPKLREQLRVEMAETTGELKPKKLAKR
jgi:DNA-directed RNA polymerase subunit beta'